MACNDKANLKCCSKPFISNANNVNNYYYLGEGNRGKCLIFNHTEFDIKGHCLATRPGSDADAKALGTCFTKLGYYVKQRKNRTEEQITNELQEVAQQIEVSVVVIVLTHQFNRRLAAKNCFYFMEDLFEPFRGDSSKALVGRPKIFLIQSCVGDRIDWSTRTWMSDSDVEKARIIPAWADFLVFHSTVPGYLTWENTIEAGSFVMQSLVHNIGKYYKTDNLESIFNVVSEEAVNFIERRKSNFLNQDKLQKVAEIKTIVRSTLTHAIHFNPLSPSFNILPKLMKSGRCLIINNQTFPSENLENGVAVGIREGSKKDVADLKSCFESLNFTVTTCIDGNRSKILNAIEREAKASATNDCFVCIISTHGETPTKLYGIKKTGPTSIEKDPYDIEDVFQSLEGLEALKNKPVIIFIQACQGTLVDHGSAICRRDSCENQPKENIELNVPWPNFFVARSCYPGYFSYRSDVNGSWFLQSVIQAIEMFDNSPVDIQTMSYLANHLVSKRLGHFSNTNGTQVEKVKQTFCFWSTLSEKVAFQAVTQN